MDYLRSVFTLNGRASPLDYWRVQVRLGLAAIVVVTATTVATVAGGWLGAIPFAFVIPLLWVGLCVCVRRLHDRGRSAWWLAIYILGPAALFAPGRLLRPSALTSPAIGLLVVVAALAGLALAGWFWIEVGFLRGQKGPNRYGPDPRALSSAA